MGLHYHTFMGWNLEDRKKLTPVWIMNSGGFNNKNIVKSVGVFNISVALNSNFK